MDIAILDAGTGLPSYIHEMLQAWGLPAQRLIPPAELPRLDPGATPVLICPAGPTVDACASAISAFAQRGGAVIALLPGSALAQAIGLRLDGALDLPARLRLSALPLAGSAGDLLPVVGRAARYAPPAPEGTPGNIAIHAHLSHPGPLAQSGDIGPGLIEAPLGRGRLIVVAFDLALSVLLCRQGDPARADRIPPHLTPADQGARAVHMVADIGPEDVAWTPHADVMARLLVDLVRRALPAPAPMLWHLPHGAPAMVVYSGDEDHCPVDGTQRQMQNITRAGGRMNLYIIPETTDTTREIARERFSGHDLGPHPNLRALDHKPVRERLDELARQVRLFEQMYGVRAGSLRTHCVVWVGYTDMAQEMERLGVEMDGCFNYGSYGRRRDPAPYVGWGAAMPLRFCRTDGQLINVRQQHTHVGDDELCSTYPGTAYSYRLTPEVYGTIARRALSDSVARFHVPYAVNIHPGNWIVFSGGHSDALLGEAGSRGLPIWSFDQWSEFLQKRDGWRLGDWSWDGSSLRWQWSGPAALPGLRGLLPAVWQGRRLKSLTLNGVATSFQETLRYQEPAAMFELPAGAAGVAGVAAFAT